MFFYKSVYLLEDFKILSYLTLQALIAQLVEQLICNHSSTQKSSKTYHKSPRLKMN